MNLLANKNTFEKIQPIPFHIIISLQNDMKRNRFLAMVAVLATQEHLTLSLLSYSPPSLLVPMNQCPFKASRRVRTTLYRVCYAWNEGGSRLAHALHRLRTPLMECRADLGQGGDASRVTIVPTPCHNKYAWLLCLFVLHPERETSIPRPLKYNSFLVVLVSVVRVGVILPHTTKSLIGGVQNTWASGMLVSVQYVPFPPVGSSAVEVTR